MAEITVLELDPYDEIIVKTDATWLAAQLLADQCRKKDVEIGILRRAVDVLESAKWKVQNSMFKF